MARHVARHYRRWQAMNRKQFDASLNNTEPATELSEALLSLWHLLRNDWDAAHRAVQDLQTPDGAWLHAHLHRVEGDMDNAGYWYRQAGRPTFTGDLAQEQAAMLAAWLVG